MFETRDAPASHSNEDLRVITQRWIHLIKEMLALEKQKPSTMRPKYLRGNSRKVIVLCDKMDITMGPVAQEDSS